ncbi:MAG TPA: SGNH/GDSL hydrolase family protein [Gemmataceae bacterium]|nr:SGNH/GDSL hydrolase family protein [Gemmataceae bacterium]
MRSRFLRFAFGFIVLAVLAPLASAQERIPTSKVLKPGDRLVIVGDSITEQKLYSRYLEDYLTACTPQLNLWILQLGWGGETAGGFLGRMDQDLLAFKPNVVTTCYGMNDGQYRPFDDKSIGQPYAANMKKLIDRAKVAGATVVVGSPGAVDTKYFRNDGKAAAMYNDNLNHLQAIDQKLAQEAGLPYADVHDVMMQVMAKAKEALGDDYAVCGRDGVHPGPNGQLIMAYAFLKALGMNNLIGVISMDMSGANQSSEGHKILKSEPGKVTVESSRYPFCFFGNAKEDKKSENNPRSILPYLRFQEEFNQFVLMVRNLKAEKAKVTWGKESKTFTREQLEKGLNLAAEFPNNPFGPAFQKLDDRVRDKQEFETQMIKNYYRALSALAVVGGDEESTAAVNLLRKKLHEKHDKLALSVRAAVVPVEYTIEVTPE